MIKDFPYVFVIGFNKTGTTSIHRLFQDNGIPSIHWDQGNLAKKSLTNVLRGDRVFSGYDNKFNVFSDMFFRTNNFVFEGNSLFRQMDKDYPGSLFIYNKRNIDDWVKSRINHKSIIGGMSIIDLEKIINNTENVNDIISHWKILRIRFEEDLKSYFNFSKNFIEIDIDDVNFVNKISLFTGRDLDPSFWKKYNFSS